MKSLRTIIATLTPFVFLPGISIAVDIEVRALNTPSLNEVSYWASRDIQAIAGEYPGNRVNFSLPAGSHVLVTSLRNFPFKLDPSGKSRCRVL